jgi:hypothetical protein
MRRRQLFQFSLQHWLPAPIRAGINDFLSFVVGRVGAARPFLPVIEEGLAHAGARRLVNLEHGLGGSMDQLAPLLPQDVEVSGCAPWDFPGEGPGLRTVINGLHSLPPDEARALLLRAAAAGVPIAALEGNNNNWWQAVGMLVFVPLMVLLFTPVIRPLTASRLVLTYVIPVIPFCIVWDGVAALFMLYGPEDLEELTAGLGESYRWRAGKRDNGRGGKIIYLLGWPSA